MNGLAGYTSLYPEEEEFRERFVALLEHPHAYFRDHLPGHVTGSAWIVDESRQFALLTHHAKLNRWLQPGGHADGDEDIVRVAFREASEETGLASLLLLRKEIFDIDIHTIPAKNGFPEHDHYDIRFILTAKMDEPFTITDESHELKWVIFEDVPKLTENNQSILRMIEKTRRLL